MSRHRDEAPRDRALRILGDPAAPVPCGIGEPAPQLGLVGEGGAREEAALRGIAQRGQQRGGVRAAQRAQREARGVELGNRSHRRGHAQRARGGLAGHLDEALRIADVVVLPPAHVEGACSGCARIESRRQQRLVVIGRLDEHHRGIGQRSDVVAARAEAVLEIVVVLAVTLHAISGQNCGIIAPAALPDNRLAGIAALFPFVFEARQNHTSVTLEVEPFGVDLSAREHLVDVCLVDSGGHAPALSGRSSPF